MLRKRFEWKFRNKTLQLGERTLLVGVLNVTPDSFSDGGKFLDPDRAFAHAVELEEAGADIIDIGAESTRPGAVKISEAEELRRLVPVLKRLRDKLAVPISVDTYKAAIAEKALELGADIINDPSALTIDPDLARTVAQFNAGLILNHMRGSPETWTKLPPLKDVMQTIVKELDASVHRAMHRRVEFLHDSLHYVLERRQLGPGFGRTAHMVQDQARVELRHGARQVGIDGQRAGIVNDVRAQLQSLLRDRRLVGIHRYRNRELVAQALEHRDQAAQFLGFGNLNGAGTRRFRADVDDIGTGLFELDGMGKGPVGIQELPAV